MPITLELRLLPEEAASLEAIRQKAIEESGLDEEQVAHVKLVRKSLDARKPPIIVLLKVELYKINEPYNEALRTFQYKPVAKEKTCLIIGSGPAGIFAALQLLESGIKPIILE